MNNTYDIISGGNGNSLCTPQKQQALMSKMCGDYTLHQLLTDPGFRRIKAGTLPRMRSVTGDTVFITPALATETPYGMIFHIWFPVLPSGKEIMHGFDYPMVQIPPSAWILKVHLPAVSLKSDRYEMVVDWFQPSQHISITQIQEQRSDGKTDTIPGIIPYTGGIPGPFEGKTPERIRDEYIFPVLKSIGVNVKEFDLGYEKNRPTF